MHGVVRLWVRQDGGRPKALAADAAGAPGPGPIVDVDARTAAEARSTYALSLLSPVMDADPEGWLAAEMARRKVRAVTRA